MALVDSVDAALTLADGRVILPNGSVRRKMTEVPTNTVAQRKIAAANRRIGELPVLPAQMNMLSVVMTYTMWGLVDHDIATATGLSIEQIKGVRNHPAYSKIQEEMLARILEEDSNTVRQLFAEHSHSAVAKLVDIMHNGDDKPALGAANSILDRAGHRPADIVEHRHRMDGALKIEITRKDSTSELPTITINPLTGVEDGSRS